jgi:hypothetical protein
MLLCADVVEHVLSGFEGCREDLCVVNTLKAVNKQWLQAARRFLHKHAGSRGMLELFRHDCVHAVGGLQLPMHCRLSPYASTRGLTVLSTLDDFRVLERSVPAVLLELCVETEACCPYSRWEPACSIREELWHDDECPCMWHFEEVLEGIYDPAFCLAKLEIKSVRLEVGGAVYTSIYDAMRTEFEEDDINSVVDATPCSQQSVLLSCVHAGCDFNGQWLSLSILRVLSKLLNENSQWCLRL